MRREKGEGQIQTSDIHFIRRSPQPIELPLGVREEKSSHGQHKISQ